VNPIPNPNPNPNQAPQLSLKEAYGDLDPGAVFPCSACWRFFFSCFFHGLILKQGRGSVRGGSLGEC
jgi:hypothetical protein